eukprot:TRINITY_DN1826_c0_g1_i3.p2 TRINITY_DN1826_c0_g1~~TRINITY_DN1826_c0_g1_i3.p2  ORF type:complete len:177 (-),score=40.10 TRINITY_DN1826_c0_g1_i3:606-1058(-)
MGNKKSKKGTYDRWWRKRVQKEEYDQVKHIINPEQQQTTLMLNPLGAPQLFSYALPPQARDYVMSDKSSTVLKTKNSYQNSIRSSENRSLPSDISYPKTPNFSDQGSSASQQEVMRRLNLLERELLQEKERRESVEKQMKQLMQKQQEYF